MRPSWPGREADADRLGRYDPTCHPCEYQRRHMMMNR